MAHAPLAHMVRRARAVLQGSLPMRVSIREACCGPAAGSCDRKRPMSVQVVCVCARTSCKQWANTTPWRPPG